MQYSVKKSLSQQRFPAVALEYVFNFFKKHLDGAALTCFYTFYSVGQQSYCALPVLLPLYSTLRNILVLCYVHFNSLYFQTLYVFQKRQR